MPLKKILIVRFSSIGDIVLTTPVIRCAKKQLDGTEIHFVTKEAFKAVLANNPNIHRIHTFQNDISEIFSSLQQENFDAVIDLHRNLRSFRLKRKLGVTSAAFNKINFRKFLAVNFKMRNRLPAKHIVDRYFEAAASFGIFDDHGGLDYYLTDTDHVDLSKFTAPFVALVIGGSYYTKQIPLNKLREICSLVKMNIVLLGGREDKALAGQLTASFPEILNGCGEFSLNQSASVISQAAWVITPDTGMMHIAAAFNKRIVSVWGNTVPEFGMGPYLPNKMNQVLQVNHLECRPCSKLGYSKCPLGHFKCMNDIDFSQLEQLG